jgi:hypothetical protein
MFVDLCSISQAGAVGQAPGPNFGRKLTKNQDKIKYIILPIGPLLAPLGPHDAYDRAGPAGAVDAEVRPRNGDRLDRSRPPSRPGGTRVGAAGPQGSGGEDKIF